MTAVQLAHNSEFITLSNNLLSELKTSYPSWEDLISKTGKFHSSLKVVVQSSSAFIDALQKVADLASKTYGGSREIGTCLTRLCLRQRRLETKLKSMSNHLITSLATPLSNKLDEWRRALIQLEKDRARQIKRARADLKRAVSEADRWQKKAAKCGSSELGPGVGHGVLPSSNLSISSSKASVIATQAANALREVQLKTEVLESTEKASVRGLMLEERGRFCFFLSCLLPLLECQCSMLGEISAIQELMQPLSKAMSNPDQLMDEAEAILFRTGRENLSSLSRMSSTKGSIYSSDGDHGSRLIAAATAALYADYDRANAGSSDDTDSGRLTMETSPIELKADDQLDRCSLSSVTQSPPGDNLFFNNPPITSVPLQNSYNNYGYNTISDATLACEVNSHAGVNQGCGAIPVNQRSQLPHGFSIVPNATGYPFNASGHLIGQRKTSIPGTATSNPLVTSYHLSRCSPQQPDTDDVQFQTLCRPGHCRSSSMGDPKLGSQVNSSQALLDETLVDGRPVAFSVNRPVVDPNWLRNCDETDSDSDADEEGDHVSGFMQSSAQATPIEDEGGEYVAVQEEVNRCDLTQTASTLTAEALLNKDAGSLNSGRHTISSAYERGATANVRGSINNLSFNPPIGKSSSKDSGVDSSTVLYPNQVLPPPVYTNLPQLAHAAQRKFSMSHIPPTMDSLPSSPSRMTVCEEKLSGSLTSTHLVETSQSNIASARQSAIDQSVNELSNIRCTPQHLVNISPGDHSAHRRTSVLSASGAGSRPCSNGIDPFSVELDELDKLGGTGSSCASSLTMASSTTSESQPSANGKTAVMNNNNNNANNANNAANNIVNSSNTHPPRRPGSTYDAQWPEHCALSQHEVCNGHRYQYVGSSSGWSGTHHMTCGTVGAEADNQRGPPGQSNSDRARFGDTPLSNETANLMSELSSQLQQLATRTVQDPVISPPPENLSRSTEDGFELPPPPPPSMFQANPVVLEASSAATTEALMTALKQSVGKRAARMAASHETPAPLNQQ